MMTWKILELSSELGYLEKHLVISGLSLLVVTILFLLRKKIGRKATTASILTNIAALCLYLGIEYNSIANEFINTNPIYAIREFMEVQAIEAEDFASDFKEIDLHVRKWYELDKQKNISLEELYQNYSRQVAQARNKKEYFDVLLRYFGELKNNHTALCYRRRQAPAKAEWRGDSLYVSFRCWETPMEIGDRIVKINGKDVLAWRDSMMNYIGASTEWTRSTATAGWVFDSYMDTIRSYTMMRGDSLYHITFPMYKDFGSAVMKAYRKAKREHRMDPVIRVVDGIPRQIYGDEYSEKATYHLIRLPRFHKADAEELGNLCRSYRNSPKVVIELLDNSGGRLKYAEEMVRYFLKKPYVTIYQDTLTPHPDAYQGEVYLLVCRYTGSAAEYFASALQESGSALLIGEETCGDFGCHNMTFCTSHGTLFTLGAGAPRTTSGGKPAEGVGLQPDIYVENSLKWPLQKTIRVAGLDYVREH